MELGVKFAYNKNVMRPLYHPSVDEITVQGILYALSDPVRVRILMELAGAECSKNCSSFLKVGKTELPKSTLSQHFKVLREAGLIRSERKGVELQNSMRCAELEKKFGPMLTAIIDAYKREQKRGA
jgi:DNA-binding transcriptional ArsR family regulator